MFVCNASNNIFLKKINQLFQLCSLIYGVFSMGRLRTLELSELSESQKKIYNHIDSGPRGGVAGPFLAWLRCPDYLEKLEQVSSYLRYGTSFSPRLSEFAILITARFWGAQYEWFAHAPIAIKAGLPKEIVESLRRNEVPENLNEDESALYDFCQQVHKNHFVSDEVYASALNRFGEKGLVELSSLIGYYTIVSMTLNVFNLDVPEGETSPLNV